MTLVFDRRCCGSTMFNRILNGGSFCGCWVRTIESSADFTFLGFSSSNSRDCINCLAK